MFTRACRVASYRLPVVLVLLTPLLAFGQSTCDDTPCSDTQSLNDLDIDCVARTVTTTSCGSGSEPTSGLIQVAVRCFEEDEQLNLVPKEARYMDIKDFAIDDTQSFDDILVGCDHFVAAARWDRGTLVDHAQCADGLLVPQCEPPTQDDLDDMSANLRLYGSILPVRGPNSCFTAGGDLMGVELRNASFTRAYRGVIAGRYICSQNATPNNLAFCDDGAPPQGHPERGMYGVIDGFNLAPQSFASIDVEPDQRNGFDPCCDFEIPNEPSPGTSPDCSPPSECSPADIMCGSAAIFEVCRDAFFSTCDEFSGSNFKLLNPVIWKAPVVDMDPGDHTVLSPPAFADACSAFDFGLPTEPIGPNRLGTDQFTGLHDFGPTPPTQSSCQDPGSPLADADFDGIYDECEPVARNLGPADGSQQFTLRQKVRNQTFFFPIFEGDGFKDTDVVKVDGQLATTELVSPHELTVTVPQIAPLTGVTDLEIEWSPDGQTFQVAPQDYVNRWFAYVAERTDDGILVMDVFHDEETRNGDLTPESNYVSLNCDSLIEEVDSPWDIAVRSAGTAVREVYSVSDVKRTDQGTDSRLFGFDVQSHRLLKDDGVVLPGSGRAVFVADDVNGYAHAYVARKVSSGVVTTSTLSVVDVDSTQGNPDPVWHLEDGASDVSIPGLAMGIRVRHFGPETWAYVTSTECVKPLMFGPCPLGGCPDHREKIHVAIVDVTDPTNMALQKVEEIYSLGVPSCDSEVLVSKYVNLGMEFSQDRSMLLIANPEKDQLEVLDLPQHNLNTRPGTPVQVGDFPVDVTVVHKNGDPATEMAYVVNRTDQDISRVEVWNDFNRLPDDIVPPIAPNRFFVAIEARSDGKRLYTANWTHTTVGVVDIEPQVPVWIKDVPTSFAPNEGLPKRITLLPLPQ